MLALPGVGVRDAEADEASAAVELLEPGSDGEAEIGVGGVEVGELVDAVVGEEDGADELVGHQTAEYLDPHGRPPQRLNAINAPQILTGRLLRVDTQVKMLHIYFPKLATGTTNRKNKMNHSLGSIIGSAHESSQEAGPIAAPT